MISGQQDSAEAQALLTALFRGSEHEQAELPDEPIEAVTDEIKPVLEEGTKPHIDFHSDEDFAALEQSVNEYKQAKQEMQRLGFTDYDEYLDYIEFMHRKAARKSDIEM